MTCVTLYYESEAMICCKLICISVCRLQTHVGLGPISVYLSIFVYSLTFQHAVFHISLVPNARQVSTLVKQGQNFGIVPYNTAVN